MTKVVVNSLWIGTSLSKLELLTIHSFIAHGHEFVLWTYSDLAIEKIEGLQLKNANEILDEKFIFQYKNSNSFGHGKGSFAGFSDIFRYKLLYELGGWWVDMDILCLKPFDFEAPYFFRKHHELLLVGNVMKCPPKSDLMLKCFEQSVREVTAENQDWHLPIQILIGQVKALGLEAYIEEKRSNFDRWEETKKFIYRRKKIPEDWYFIHWQNEEWRNKKRDKNQIRYHSTLGKQMQKHKLLKKEFSFTEKVLNYLQTL